jgi:hypothetical protein
MMMNNKKIFSIFRLAAFLTALSLFAVLTFEALHAGHEENCHEENCAICLVLQVIHNTKKVSASVPLASVDFSIFNYINLFIFSALFFAPATLVKQKVKLVI